MQRSSEDYDYVQRVLAAGENGQIHFDCYDVILWETIDKEMAGMIQATTDDGIILLGSLMTFYGTPCSMTFTEDNINLQYPNFYITTKVEYDLAKPESLHTSLSPFMKVESINLLDANTTCETPVTFATSQNIVREWRGFRSINYYVSKNMR
jgi:hypothetical protein